MMSTYLPTVFGENLMDAFDDFDLFRGFGNVDRALYGKHAQNVMKTDVKETDDGYEVDVDLPGFKKDEIHLALDIDTVYDILAAGTVKAAETTNETLAQVRKAMRIDYFTDRSIVKEWETLLRKANQ